MSHRTFHLVRRTVVGAILVAATAIHSTADTERARTAYTEWSRVMTQLSQERAEWLREKSMISDTLAAGRAELEAIDQRIAEIAATSGETDRKRAELTEQIDEARATADTLAARVGAFEQRVRALLPLLPEPTRAELQPAIQMLPADPRSTKVPLSQRAATVVMLLAQIDKFNSGINLVSEIRDLGAGRTVEVKTIYFGLATAYFADANLTTTGYGTPGPQGWEWKPADAKTGELIALAIAMHENTKPPAFVSLPVVIR
ncbi:MAG: DUF3450 family protein [Opitutaceae bacterium]|nr:DUF3450 family protein [Opitutaceae bacterium]